METEKNGYALNNEEFGTVKIANDVVAMIAGLAATEVDMKKQTKGVKVDILDGNVSVELAVTMEYGFNIPTTCNKVQEKVKNAIETMTGFKVSDVNIRIVGIKMASEK